ncbi:unnamed protein product [Musa acuminata subsp. malaccensis]|uniref:(wild Malaysian banana) hypothetical protein n=1 Tax=Musa acuminata subsp. malaccensis TaxID=214687 RepID=A0A804JCH9_MUSAM|nr:unnamed protein product [Musa acuminata subsp. malaccensis]
MLRSSSSSSSQATYLQPYPPQFRLRHTHDRVRSSSSSPACPSCLPGLRFREKLLYLENDLGVDSSRASASALALNPSLRSAPPSALRASADSLHSFGLVPPTSPASSPWTPPCSPATPAPTPVPVFRFLLGPVAIPLPDLRKAVGRCPRLLVSSVSDELRPALHFLRRRTTLLLVSSVEDALLPKLDYLRGLGFSHEETRSMVLRSPGLLTFSIENNFRPKVEFLIHDMGRDLAELKDFPQ